MLTFLLFFSCTRYAPLVKDSVGLQVGNIKMDIDNIHEIEWFVGHKKEAKVSQGLTFFLEMPHLRDEDMAFLTEKKGIDAWIIRLISVKGSQSQDLGSLYTPFRAKRVTRGARETIAPSSVVIKISYAAAYASERFRAFKCPAFSHRKKIVSAEARGENTPFDLKVGQTIPYQEKSQAIELTPSSFNGGNSLVGEYHLEMTFYDSQKKLIHGDFKRIPRYLAITKEEEIDVKSCEGEHPEFQ